MAKRGSLVAMMKGVDSEKVRSVLYRKIPIEQRRIVKEITLDMAANMEQIVRKTFTKAILVTDRFHVQKNWPMTRCSKCVLNTYGRPWSKKTMKLSLVNR